MGKLSAFSRQNNPANVLRRCDSGQIAVKDHQLASNSEKAWRVHRVYIN